MSKKEKLIARLRQKPPDFTWRELVRLLHALGYAEVAGGKTGGSRRKFVHASAPTITLHKPHPHNTLKHYQVKQVLALLEKERLI